MNLHETRMKRYREPVSELQWMGGVEKRGTGLYTLKSQIHNNTNS